MKNQKTDLNHNRRDFVKKTAIATVGVTAATVLPGTALASEAVPQQEPKQQKGYQVTQHVVDYYKSAAS